MHSLLSRAQTTLSTLSTYASILASLIAIVSILTLPVPSLPSNTLQLHNVQTVKGRPHYYSTKKEEYAHVKFDLDADLSALFTWNTKQVFVYVVAEYPDDRTGTVAESVVWDAVLKSPLQAPHHNQYVYPAEKAARKKSSKGKAKAKKASTIEKVAPTPGQLKLAAQRPKYQITDPSGKIAGVGNATLSLRYNVQPWVGALVWGGAAERVGVTGDWVMGLVPDFVKDLTWKTLGAGARSEAFAFPALKERSEAAKEAGGSLNVERGGERRAGEFF